MCITKKQSYDKLIYIYYTEILLSFNDAQILSYVSFQYYLKCLSQNQVYNQII